MGELKVAQYSAPRTRVLDAALDLFDEHGVSGTSLQMIADSIGITKAAVYHQFRTKDDIVIAVTERELGRLVPELEKAEAHSEGSEARDALLAGVIDMAVRDAGRCGPCNSTSSWCDSWANTNPFNSSCRGCSWCCSTTPTTTT